MLGWLTALSAVCAGSAAAGFGMFGPITNPVSGTCLTIAALSGVLLISSFEAFETQAATDHDQS